MKKYTKEEREEYVKKRNQELQNKIYSFAEELAKLTDETKFNKKFIEFLEFKKKFWRYSIYNQILINIQCPNATYVTGFRKWSDMGRTVNAGEKAIYILCPMFYPDKELTILTYANTGKTEFKKVDIAEFITGFKSVPVFDVSQTHGKELPKLEYELNTDEHPDLLKQAETVIREQGINLLYKPLENGHFGYTDGKTIVINKNISTDDKLHTIIHERLHFMKHFTEDRKNTTKKQRETEAEATSYIVCRLLGIKPSKSYNYLALYNSDSKLILESLNRIDHAIKQLFKELEIKTPEERVKQRVTAVTP